MLARQLSFLANADSAGLVLGARVPIIVTSRADGVRSRITVGQLVPSKVRALDDARSMVPELSEFKDLERFSTNAPPARARRNSASPEAFPEFRRHRLTFCSDV
jgi:hypothetical protein